MAPIAAATRKRPRSSFAAVGILDRFLNVLDSDQSLDAFVFIDHQKFFDAVFLQYGLGLLERGADRNGDQRLLGHHFRNRNIEARFKTQVAIGDDADEMAVFIHHRHAADLEIAPLLAALRAPAWSAES